MPIALKRVAVDDGVVISVFAEKRLKLKRKFGETWNWHGHILDEAGGTDLAGAAHGGEDAAAHGPPLARERGVGGEFGGGGKLES